MKKKSLITRRLLFDGAYERKVFLDNTFIYGQLNLSKHTQKNKIKI